MLGNEMIQRQFDRIDRVITTWMARYGLFILHIGLGVIFFWFGALKLFPGLSPAEDLVRSSVPLVNPDWFISVLAVWEMAIGLGLIFGVWMRLTLVMLPSAVWTQFPFGLTMEGQYIIKNLALIGAGIVLGGTVRGGRLEPEPNGLRRRNEPHA